MNGDSVDEQSVFRPDDQISGAIRLNYLEQSKRGKVSVGVFETQYRRVHGKQYRKKTEDDVMLGNIKARPTRHTELLMADAEENYPFEFSIPQLNNTLEVHEAEDRVLLIKH